MNIAIATKSYAIDNFLNFNGRASRWEYWGGSLVFSITINLVGTGLLVFSYAVDTIYGILLVLVLIIFYIWGIIAQLSASIRRLHDVGRSGWNLLWMFTGFGAFYLLYLDVQPSVQKDSEWVPPPPHTIEI